jgi:hypothetical protein
MAMVPWRVAGVLLVICRAVRLWGTSPKWGDSQRRKRALDGAFLGKLRNHPLWGVQFQALYDDPAEDYMVAQVYGETIEKEMKQPGLNGTHQLKRYNK